MTAPRFGDFTRRRVACNDNAPGMSGPASAAVYEIQVEGVLGPHWAAWLGNLQIENDGRQTIISGLLTDQAALHGLLAKVRDLGLCLISVQRLQRNDQAGTRKPLTKPGPGNQAQHNWMITCLRTHAFLCWVRAAAATALRGGGPGPQAFLARVMTGVDHAALQLASS